ncbi:hypothetical protein HPP92_019100 [Vanilla planifolia]|uniref:Protein kinase domain-containing protein n=1 Tax=Vanilla planifolia TaxID=51239 RepID=A0A835QB68_VANPL|nr:hypothetical protein HPP92_019100 [Vanilla planifolia]
MDCSRRRMDLLMSLLFAFWCQNLVVCGSVDAEVRALLSFKKGVETDPYGALLNWGKPGVDHCLWFGVRCSDDGRVESLDLKDLCLQGELTSELGSLFHLKSLILHNNSFTGKIPREISALQKLEILDLGHNNFIGPFPRELLRIVNLKEVVLRNNRFISEIPHELLEFNGFSIIQGDKDMPSSDKGSFIRHMETVSVRKLLRDMHKGEMKPHKNKRFRARYTFSTLPTFYLEVDRLVHNSPQELNSAPAPSPAVNSGKKETQQPMYISASAGIFLIFSLSSMYSFCCRSSKVESVMSGKTGLSGKLQKALVIGVPSLKRSELQKACEDFSNVIDSLSDCTLYKGTLSSGVEIAVTTTLINLVEDWSDQQESLFRNKISLLSKVNHKNFMNLIGYCEEQEPFTRMMVFEYAPNGTLFEHLHIKEAEPLDWPCRLRIAMGIAYFLEHMHLLEPPVSLRTLNSSTIYLTEDYAAKVSDLPFWNEVKAAGSATEFEDNFEMPLSNQDIVYKFGILLLELISGRLPFSKDDGLLVLWASSHLTGKRPLHGIADPTLGALREEDICRLCDVIQRCINPEPRERPPMAEVVAKLREITEISPEAANPKLSPLWWAELEIIS